MDILRNSSSDGDLPFQNLNDFEIEQLFISCRQEILSRLNNPVLLNYLKNKNCVNLQTLDNIDCNYFTEEDFNLRIQSLGNNITLSIFHLNIRKIALHRNELIAFLSMLKLEFDIIVLTEVGKDSEKFIESSFPDYEPFYDLPKSNDYGGVAVFVKSDLNVTKRALLFFGKSFTKFCW